MNQSERIRISAQRAEKEAEGCEEDHPALDDLLCVLDGCKCDCHQGQQGSCECIAMYCGELIG